jgi:hypothetical protein
MLPLKCGTYLISPMRVTCPSPSHPPQIYLNNIRRRAQIMKLLAMQLSTPLSLSLSLMYKLYPHFRHYLSIYLSIYLPIYGSTALCWTLAAFSVSGSFTQSVGLLGRGISLSQGSYLHTGHSKRRINAHTDIHASRGIRTYDLCLSWRRRFIP